MRVIALRFVFLSFLLFGVTANSEIRAQSDFKVTLLGTGTPILSIDRFGPSTLVEAGNQKFLFDAGRGATIRLHQLGAGRVRTAIEVDHGPHDKPAFGCRIDYDGRSVLISGDTRFNENVGGNGQLGRSKEL